MEEGKKSKGEKGIYILLGIMTLFNLLNVLYNFFKRDADIWSIIEFLVLFASFIIYTIQLKKKDPNFLKRKR